jgi:hypothetical protein
LNAQSGANTSATAAATSASTAQGAADSAQAFANAFMWDAATFYAVGDLAISPTDFEPYRRIVAGTTATDPAADSTNWIKAADYYTKAETNALVFPSGTKMLFQQTAAPTGWTKDTTHDNKALRVVSGTAGSGGSVAFSTAFALQAVSGSVANHTLTTAQMPAHNHSASALFRYNNATVSSGSGATIRNPNATGSLNWNLATTVNNNGSSNAHNHGFTGTAINLAVQYVDLIIATKD